MKQPEQKATRRVPAGKVLITFDSDWFSYESYYFVHEAGSEVDEEALFSRGAKLLSDGESLDVVSKIRDDSGLSWTIENRRVTNSRGKAQDDLLASGTVP